MVVEIDVFFIVCDIIIVGECIECWCVFDVFGKCDGQFFVRIDGI